jgi:hypothetical protein
MLITGGSAGVGGWAFKDHPVLQALLGRVLPRDDDGSVDREKIVSAVTEALHRDDGKLPGVYRVKITEVRLDPRLFKEGHTVDIQARVLRRDAAGGETTAWESRPYGENLGRVGRDDLTATWSNRPFEIEWSPGGRIFVDVWDRKSGLFDRKELRLAPPDPDVFPLASGTHPLTLAGASLDPAQSRIVFDSHRIGDRRSEPAPKSRPEDPREVAERPIVIR